MNSNELYLEAAELKDKIHQALYHPYIFKHIELPVIDDDKLLLLCSLTTETNKAIRRETILNTMLVQIALDIHDRVMLIDLTSNNHKARQLTVLAGDYYSSLYYERLTAINQQKLVRSLADGIRKVNELKTKFLYSKNIEISELLLIQSKIESTIMNQFSVTTTGKELPNVFIQLLLLKRLVHEKILAENGEYSLWTHLFGRHIHGIQSSPDKIGLLSNKEFKQTIQTVESLIYEKYRKLEAMLANSDDDVANSMFHNQSALLNKMSRFANLLFSEEG